jgi:hypothetical protein
MKELTASEARKRWFRLLDEALQGEVIAVQRKGQRVVLRREDLEQGRGVRPPDYRRLLRVPHPDDADRWSWQWRAPGRPLAQRRARPR